MSKKSSSGNTRTQMTKSAAARIQSAACKKNQGKTPSSSFAARAQRVAAKGNGK